MFFNQSTCGAAWVSWRMQVCFEYARTSSSNWNHESVLHNSKFNIPFEVHTSILKYHNLTALIQAFCQYPFYFHPAAVKGKKMRCKIWHLLGGFDCLSRGKISSDQYKLTKIFIFRAGWRPWQVELLLDITTAAQTFCPWRHFRLAYAML